MKVAHAQTVLLSNDISEVTSLPLRTIWVAQNNDGQSFAGESLLSLYRNSYTVQLLSCFYGILFPDIMYVFQFSPFRKWGYVQGVLQHVTIGIIPSFGMDPTCKTLIRLHVFREVRIPNSSCGGWMPHTDTLESPYQSIYKICDRACQLLSGFGTDCRHVCWTGQFGCWQESKILIGIHSL